MEKKLQDLLDQLLNMTCKIELRTNRRAADNMRLAQWGVTCKVESSCFYSALVQVDSLVLLSPPLRQAQKRYAALL